MTKIGLRDVFFLLSAQEREIKAAGKLNVNKEKVNNIFCRLKLDFFFLFIRICQAPDAHFCRK